MSGCDSGARRRCRSVARQTLEPPALTGHELDGHVCPVVRQRECDIARRGQRPFRSATFDVLGADVSVRTLSMATHQVPVGSRFHWMSHGLPVTSTTVLHGAVGVMTGWNEDRGWSGRCRSMHARTHALTHTLEQTDERDRAWWTSCLLCRSASTTY